MTNNQNSMDTFITVFYSNYSGNCKALLQQINNSNIMDKLSIKFMNIDNNDIRNVITKKFSVVPTIVVLSNDEISLYAGDNAFEWFNIFVQQQIDYAQQAENIQRTETHTQSTEMMVSKESKKTILELAAELSDAREKQQ
jgi:hypothetical protein